MWFLCTSKTYGTACSIRSTSPGTSPGSGTTCRRTWRDAWDLCGHDGDIPLQDASKFFFFFSFFFEGLAQVAEGLAQVTLPNTGAMIAAGGPGKGAFSGCTSLGEIALPPNPNKILEGTPSTNAPH